MFCKSCLKLFPTRAKFLVHVSEVHNSYAPLSLRDDEKDTDSDKSIQDTDEDPDWEPEVTEMHTDSSPQSSPVTQQQEEMAWEVEEMLIPISIRPTDISIGHTQVEDQLDNKKPRKEVFDEEKNRGGKRISNNVKKLTEQFESAAFPQSPVEPVRCGEVASQLKEKKPIWKEKFLELQKQMDVWKAKRKEAFKEGKKSTAKRISKNIKKLADKIQLATLHQSPVEPVGCEEVVNQIQLNNDERTKVIMSKKRKHNYCIYCEELVSKFAEHIVKKHKTTPEGVSLLKITGDKGYRRRKKMSITGPIRKKWNKIYNEKNPTKLILVKQTTDANHTNVVVCAHCNGYYRRDKLSVHLKRCKEFKSKNDPINSSLPAIKKHSISHCPQKDLISEEFKKEILDGIQMDDIISTALNDPAIMSYASEFHKSRREKKSIDYVRRVMRDLTKLLIEVKTVNPAITKLDDALNPACFDDIVQAALNMAGYDKKTGEVKVPSIAYRISQPLNECISTLKNTELKNMYKSGSNTRLKFTMLNDLEGQIKSEWKKSVGRICSKALKLAKVGKTQVIAEEADIIKLAAHIEGSYKKLVKRLKDQKDHDTFNYLTHSLVTHIMLLVRRRPVDFKSAKLYHFNNVDKHDELFKLTEKDLTEEQIKVCKQFHIFYVPGKNLEIVPIVLTKTMRYVLEAIIEHRKYVDIKSDLLFVLAEDKNIQPTDSIRVLKKQVKLKKPEHLTGNGLRHQAATFSKLHSDHPQYQDFLASVLGHSLHVHKKNYDLPVGINQKLMVCPILHNIMTGRKGQESLSNGVTDEPAPTETVVAECSIEVKDNNEILRKQTLNPELKTLPVQPINSQSSTCEGDSSESDSYKDDCDKFKTPKKKTKWSASEMEPLLFFFSKKILQHIPPHRSEVVKFLRENPTVCNDRTVDQVYIYLRNHALRCQQNITPKIKRILQKFN